MMKYPYRYFYINEQIMNKLTNSKITISFCSVKENCIYNYCNTNDNTLL